MKLGVTMRTEAEVVQALLGHNGIIPALRIETPLHWLSFTTRETTRINPRIFEEAAQDMKGLA
jgi:hypothetical protein